MVSQRNNLCTKKIASFFLIMVSFWTSGQSFKQDSISPEIIQLCNKIGPSNKIIGLGESTHGTKEFTLIRAEIVKNLITNHNYKVFVLEAEYMICAKINDYVKTGKGNPESSLKNLTWPWVHKDFLDLIHWIRDYNIQNPSGQVRFLGMDAQFSKVYATQDTIRNHYPVLANSIFEIIDSDKKPKRKIEQLRELSDQLVNQSSEVDLRLHYYIFCRINRIANSEYRDLNARDQNMAQLSCLIHKKYGDKVIIWAHNSHIWKKNPSIFDRIPTGYYLDQNYGDKYAAIGFDFKSGSFTAVSYDKATKYERKVFQLKPIKNTLSMEVDYLDKKFIIIDCSDLKGKNYINSIGAIYIENPEKGDNFTSKIKKDSELDYIILTPTSTPTDLIID
ncbi:MAG TPA: erythromycin esterase family protein [Saprospiraceae bacterium]|nr:erythromycin esterase family protein [Saprospiraceae bacterium]